VGESTDFIAFCQQKLVIKSYFFTHFKYRIVENPAHLFLAGLVIKNGVAAANFTLIKKARLQFKTAKYKF
jgi:hypothetical protein